jgi:hypothetical protein
MRRLPSRGIRRGLLERRLPVRSLLVGIGLSTVVSVSIGFAAALAITPERLTIHTAASAVPVSTCTPTTSAADTYAAEGSSGSNFGTATTMHVRSATTLILLPDNKRSFVRFDLSSCAIPTGARVLTAQLNLFLSTAPSSSRTYEAHRITQSWGETTLDWGNQPTTAALATSSVATGTTANVTRTWDVVADVRTFVAGTATNHGWRIKDAVESASGEGRFSTREHATASQRPRLVITYYP